MRLTDYYKFSHLEGIKAKTRFECVESTGEYEPFKNIAKNGNMKIYYTDTPQHYKGEKRRKANKCITGGGQNISSIYTDIDTPLLGYGDTKNTNDALLFQFNQDFTQIEIFIARGLKNHLRSLFYLFQDGELDNEKDMLRQQAQKITSWNV